MPPRASNKSRRTSTDNGTPDITRLIDQQLMVVLPNIVTQVATSMRATQGNTGGSGTTVNTYKSFISCKPKEFYGTEGAIGLLKWIENMETILQISNCAEENKTGFASCQLQDRALTWWNMQLRIRGHEAAYQLSWEEFTNLLREEYDSKAEKQKQESEFQNHAMEGAKTGQYTDCYYELARLVPCMVTPKGRVIDRYLWGSKTGFRGTVTSPNPTTVQSAVVLANHQTSNLIRPGKLTDEKPSNKRKADLQSERKTGGNLDNKQKRTMNFVATTHEANRYAGSSPRCNKCNYHHTGDCPTCGNCNRRGHYAKYCKLDKRNKGICFECGSPDHYRNVCLSINNGPNNNHGNQTRQAKQGNHGGQVHGESLVIEAVEAANTSK